MTEKSIQSDILRVCGSMSHVRLFRNTVGVGYVGRPGALTKIRFGLMPGSADLIGWRTITVTPDLLGAEIAQFVSIEVKKPGGKPSPEQWNWFYQVRQFGGMSDICTNAFDAQQRLNEMP